jgi:hypothetical protein
MSILAVLEAARQTTAPELQHIPRGWAIGEFLPELIPHSLTGIAQERPRPDLQ